MVQGNIKPFFDELARILRLQTKDTSCITASSSDVANPQTIRSKYASITIVKTGADVTTLTFKDGTTYQMTSLGETLVISANPGGDLPSFDISGGSYKWAAVK